LECIERKWVVGLKLRDSVVKEGEVTASIDIRNDSGSF
jgi:hypothetical protein